MNKFRKFLHFFIPISCAVIAHATLGIHPVFGRYLQQVRGLPTFSLAALVHIIAFIASLPRFVYLLYKMIKKHGKNILREELIPIVKNWLLWVFIININVLNFCYVGASRLTLATYTQLILLTTPFMVAILGRVFLKEKVKPATWICMVIMVVGGSLVVLGGTTKHEMGGSYKFKWTIDFSKLGEGLTMYDAIGMALSLATSLTLAVYMLVVKYCQTHENPISSEAFYFWQIASCSICGIPVSFILGEDWSKYYDLNLSGWLIVIAYGVISFCIGNLTQIYAIAILGAPAVSSLLALRLVTAVLFAMFILNEYLNNFWQIMGCLIVVVTVTLYMSYKYYMARQEDKKKKKTKEIEELESYKGLEDSEEEETNEIEFGPNIDIKTEDSKKLL